MKIFIPEIGDEITLSKDWTFELKHESRNESLFEKFYGTHEFYDHPLFVSGGALNYTIPAGSVLKIDRVYIRKGQSDFSSVTFLWKGESIPAHYEDEMKWDRKTRTEVPTGKQFRVSKKPVRFWAKLADVNTMHINDITG